MNKVQNFKNICIAVLLLGTITFLTGILIPNQYDTLTGTNCVNLNQRMTLIGLGELLVIVASIGGFLTRNK